MKHEQYAMILEKASNVDLVVFVKNDHNDGEWEVCDFESMIAHPELSFYLCLPKHNENGQMLHWLNGGHETLECNSPFTDGFERCYTIGSWKAGGGYMRSDVEYKIKPKKEKRWIAYSTNQKRLGCLTFDSEVEARNHYIHEVDEPQFIEIEVEV